MRLIPEIVNIGVYDAALIHGDIISTKPRKTALYEIEYVLNNGGTSYIDDKATPIKKGNIIFAKPGQLRHTDLPYKCLYIHTSVEDDALRSLLNSVPNFFTPVNFDVFEAVFYALIAQIKFPDRRNSIDTSIKFLEILSLMIKASKNAEYEPPIINENMKIIHNAIEFIDNNYTQNISLDDIASHVHLSKIYFHNFFLKTTGQTPHGYLISRRIDNVKFLLTMTDKSFSEIASDSGFSSQAYMTYVFKKKMSCTPMQYKKALNNSK